MKNLLAGLLLLPLLALAQTKLDLDVRLDPASRRFEATATLTDARGLAGFALSPEFEVTELSADGRRIEPRHDRGPPGRYALPAGTREARVAYRGTLAATASLDHREVLSDRRPVAAPEGSFLPGAALWHPDPGRPFSYRVALALPPGQKGLVPGDLLKEAETAAGYRAEFDFPHPAEDIDLMAGPWVVGERALRLRGGREVKIRTWFHADLAGLSQGYLDDSARYIDRYSRLIGDYPFGMFSVVASPTPTGFGMPSLTYLGREVLRLPFIRATSLGHEVLHNWWGNGVYPDWKGGNWSEGLTTFLADYAYKEDPAMGGGEDAAREMRLGWLRDLAAVPPAGDTALKDFTSRRHGISSIVGYDKSAMVFLMLRDAIGREAFERGLKLLWEKKRFGNAGWGDLEAAFAQAAGRPLREFFRQWVGKPGSPSLTIESAEQRGGELALRIAQSGEQTLRVPVRLKHAGGGETRWIETRPGRRGYALAVAAAIDSVELDPDYRLWRRVDAALLPPILRETFVAPNARAVLAASAEGDAELRAAALSLAARVLDARPEKLEAQPPLAPMLLLGQAAAVDAWLARHGLPPRPQALPTKGSAQVWAGRDAAGRPYAVVAARDAAALKALERALPHYGRQSWLAFDGGRAAEKGVWPPRAAVVKVAPGGAR